MEKININNLFSSKENVSNGTNNSSKPLDIYSLFHRDVNKIYNFSVEKLINVRENREKEVLKEYRKKYKHCLDRIEEINNLDKYDTVYTIPMVIYDCTDYKPEDCIKYIEKKLKKYYIDTLVLSHKSIFISWNNIKKNRDKAREEKNKIKQLEKEEREIVQRDE